MKIKKIIILLIFLLLVSTIAFGQENALTIGMGFAYPFGNDMGTSFMINFGKDYDESVFYGLGLNFYFTQIDWSESFVGSEKSSGLMLPLYGLVRVRFNISLPFSVFVTGGMGGAFYFDIADSLTTSNNTKTMTYFGFHWQIGAGMGIMLGSKTDGELNFILSSSSLGLLGAIPTDYPYQDSMNITTIQLIFSIRFFHM